MSHFLPPTGSNDSSRTHPQDLSVNTVQKQRKSIDKRATERASSLGDWMRSKLPSQKPERGGTIRERGFWAQAEEKGASSNYPRRRATDSYRSRRSETGDSDLITRWNTPKDLPDIAEHTPVPLPRRAVSSTVPKAIRPNSVVSDDRRLHLQKVVEPEQQVTAARQGSGLTSETELGLKTQSLLDAETRLSQERQAIEAKKESRRQRRRLKESGDYLGVQGYNPNTGEFDTTESEFSSESLETKREINALKQDLRDATLKYEETAQQSQNRIKQLIKHRERQKMEKGKDGIAEPNLLHQGLLKWRRHTRQWSSAQEPDLSPIAQSYISGASESSECSTHVISKIDHL